MLEHDRNPNEANPHPSVATEEEKSVVSNDQTCPKQVMSPTADISSDLTHPKQIIAAVAHNPARQGFRITGSPSVSNIKTPLNTHHKLNKKQPSSSASLFKKRGKPLPKSQSGTKPDQNSKITTIK